MAAFAAGALTFERRYGTATSTRMSLYSWYTGLPAYRMPIRDPGTATLPVGQGRTLGEVLHRRGDRVLNTLEVLPRRGWRSRSPCTRTRTRWCAATTNW